MTAEPHSYPQERNKYNIECRKYRIVGGLFPQNPSPPSISLPRLLPPPIISEHQATILAVTSLAAQLRQNENPMTALNLLLQQNPNSERRISV